MDWSVPLDVDETVFVDVSKKTKAKRNDFSRTYVAPLGKNAWIGIAIFFPCSTVILLIFDKLTAKYLLGQEFSPQSVIAFVLMSAIGKRFPREPTTVACRTAFLSASLTGFILISLYKSMLVATIAVKQESQPFNNFQEVAESGVKVYVGKGTSEFDEFKHAPFNSPKKQIYQRSLVIMDDPADVHKILSNKRHYDDYSGLVASDLKEIRTLPCKVNYMILDMPKYQFGFAFQKNWPFTPLFNIHLEKLKASGIIDRINHKYFKDWKSMEFCIPEPKYEPSNLVSALLLYLILGMGMVFCIFVWICELIISRNKDLIR